jgi:hypothetical protein
VTRTSNSAAVGGHVFCRSVETLTADWEELRPLTARPSRRDAKAVRVENGKLLIDIEFEPAHLETCATPRDLAEALRAYPTIGRRLFTGIHLSTDVHAWLLGSDRSIIEAFEHDRRFNTLDYQILCLSSALDRSTRPNWMGWKLDLNSLAGWAAEAAWPEQRDFGRAPEDLFSLYESRVLSALPRFDGFAEFEGIDGRWHTAFESYQNAAKHFGAEVGMPPDEYRTAALAVSLLTALRLGTCGHHDKSSTDQCELCMTLTRQLAVTPQDAGLRIAAAQPGRIRRQIERDRDRILAEKHEVEIRLSEQRRKFDSLLSRYEHAAQKHRAIEVECTELASHCERLEADLGMREVEVRELGLRTDHAQSTIQDMQQVLSGRELERDRTEASVAALKADVSRLNKERRDSQAVHDEFLTRIQRSDDDRKRVEASASSLERSCRLAFGYTGAVAVPWLAIALSKGFEGSFLASALAACAGVFALTRMAAAEPMLRAVLEWERRFPTNRSTSDETQDADEESAP